MCALLETRVKAKNFAKVFHNTFLGWECINNYYHAVNGIIWLAWNPLIVQAKHMTSSDQCIHVELNHITEGLKTELTVVYASNSATERKKLWAYLKDFSHTVKNPWLLMGDFNEVASMEENVVWSCSLQ